MANFQIFKETALPSQRQPHSIYLVAPPGNPNFVEVYVTSADGSVAKRTPTQSDIQAMIDAAVAAGSGSGIIVDTIAARNALTGVKNAQQVYVIDATADATVSSGGATYVWRSSNSSWIKTSEAESLDLSLTWAALTGKPSSTPANIDAAVTARHTHTNKSQLDLIGQDSNGNMTYDGRLPVTEWNSAGW